MTPARPVAILFDLLTGLLDSWSLWDRVAGNREAGRQWRAAYLRNTYREGRYRDYETLVREAALETGLPAGCADDLARRYGELEPWPEAAEILCALAARVPLAIVTNCSERLGRIAAGRLGVTFASIVTAERAGWYKPDARPYALALQELGAEPEAALFVAGSAYDLVGAAAVGLPVVWHDRIGMAPPQGAPAPLAHCRSLRPLLDMVSG